jgi:hypothetical protein
MLAAHNYSTMLLRTEGNGEEVTMLLSPSSDDHATKTIEGFPHFPTFFL